MKLHLWLPAVAALITTPPRHRATTQQRAAQTPPALEAASFDALGGNIVLKALRRRCVGRRAQRCFAAYNATLAADYAETLAAHDVGKACRSWAATSPTTCSRPPSPALQSPPTTSPRPPTRRRRHRSGRVGRRGRYELPTASLLAAAPATRAFEADAFERDEHGCMTTALADTPASPRRGMR